ncbi:ABC-type transport system, involved in lipoprotein release, permease component [Gottschalkia purinilytica]|uniref:ABC-type transport system, involved in lipoprotein release, permease component n=1 Tax=Gottschalkia purinilytica TaxID=1503 RepID=A0A0L0WDL0_GOTPU|nr:ABC transporter permease [Gottschalkia purinilytica]KNF09563.1 ABC-type transport system, involved in lipoprotein release, permease component [Gottschalkia purinilytica]
MLTYVKIAWKYITNYSRRTLSIILSIALSTFLIVTIGSLSESSKNANANYIRKSIGVQHVRYNDLNMKQLNKIKNNKNIKTLANTVYCGKGEFEDRLSVNILAADKNILYMDNTELIRGEYPIRSDEIAIEKWVLDRLNLPHELGQTISFSMEKNNRIQEFKLVGIIKDREKSKARCELEGYIAFNKENITNNENYIFGFVEFKEGLNINKEINNLAKEIGIKDKKDIKINKTLLEAIGKLNVIDWNLVKISLMLMIIGGMVVYSLYSMSVLKRVQEYGMMRAIGITSKQMILVILSETIIIYIIGMILGTMMGICSLNLFKGSTMGLFTEGNVKLNTVVISTFAIKLSMLISIISLILSSIRATFLTFKVSPIEAINKTTQDKNINFNMKESFIEKHISISSKVSYKNLKRNKKTLIFAISVMSIGCILFISRSFKDELFERDYDYQRSIDKSLSYEFRLNVDELIPMKYGYTKKQLEEMKSIQGIGDIVAKQVLYSKIKFNKEDINNINGISYLESQDKSARSMEGVDYKFLFKGDNDKELVVNNTILGLSDSDLKSLNKLIPELKIDVDKMKKEYSAIVIIPKANRKGELWDKKEKNLKPVFNKKVGDKIKITIPREYYDKSMDNYEILGKYEKYKSQYIDKEFEITEILNYDDISFYDKDHNYLGIYSNPYIIVSEDIFKEFSGIDTYRIVHIDMKQGADYNYVKKKVQNMSEIFKHTNVMDSTGKDKQIKRAVRQQSTLRNSIIVVLIIISGLSIFNNINQGLVTRIREHGIMKAVGFTDKQFRRMIRFEGLMYGGISALFSCTLAFIIQLGIFIYYVYYKDWLLLKKFFIQPEIYLIVIAINLAIGYIATLGPIRQVNKVGITEAISSVE